MQSSIGPSSPSAQSRRSLRFGILLVTLALAACGDSGTTGGSSDTVAPVVRTTNPASGASGVVPTTTVAVTFSEAMDPLSISAATFTLLRGDAPVAGDVVYGPGTIATFTPVSPLYAGTVFTASLSTGAKDVAGNPLAAALTWTFTTAAAVPTLASTFPADIAPAVPLNARLAAVFDMAMSPLGATTFTLKQGSTPVAGTVANSADGKSATFAPAQNLLASSPFTATISAGAMSAGGVHLAADRSWTFTTGTAADTTAPVVSSTSPEGGATGVAIQASASATFSKAMDPASLSATTFTLRQGTTPVAGSVAYGPGNTATFTPASPLAGDTLFTAAFSVDVKDLQNNPLASAFSWTFRTGSSAARGPAPVLLGTAGNYVILAKAGISTVPASSITGDIAVSPAAATYMTGFSLVADSSNVFSRSTQIVGKAFAANYAVPSPAKLTTAVSDMETAYTDAAGRPTPNFLELGTGNIGGKTLVPGLYKWTSTVTVPADVVLFGGADDVWIFQTTKDITVSAGKRITLSGGARAKNVFWEVAGAVTIGARAHFEGVLLCKTGVTLQTGATMTGRILAQTAVILQQATVTSPAQ